jgi:hypothetical protein
MIREHNVTQGSDEWFALRCGLLTASELKLIMTPTLKPAANDKERAHLYEILAQRLTGHVEPAFQSDAMLRGYDDEDAARALYAKRVLPVRQVGFITNDRWGFTLGYSPDGVVGDDGLIEVKSRKQSLHFRTIVEDVSQNAVPSEHVIQVQAGLLISGREWCDVISYSNGLPMAIVRAYPDPTIAAAIIDAAAEFEARIAQRRDDYLAALLKVRSFETVRTSRELHV